MYPYLQNKIQEPNQLRPFLSLNVNEFDIAEEYCLSVCRSD